MIFLERKIFSCRTPCVYILLYHKRKLISFINTTCIYSNITSVLLREMHIMTTLLCIYFLFRYSFTNIHDSQDNRGRGEAISLTPLYHFHPLHRHVDTSWTITAESSPLHIANTPSQTGDIWFPSTSR